MFNKRWVESERCGLLSETDHVYPFHHLNDIMELSERQVLCI